jgi:exodeoxyribonuclease III
MKIATWNVNSIRSRLEHVCQWLDNQQATSDPIDVLCLQETKVIDQDFPQAAFEALGYQVYISGQKSYNGVALLSRTNLDKINIGFSAILGESASDLDEQKRVISGKLGELWIVDLYVPNGSEIGSEKYHYKLRWLATLRDYLKTLLNQHTQVLVCGDFNVAPEDRDIHSPAGRETHIMASDAERHALSQAILDLGFVDAFRQFNSEAGQFTWWDYRTGAFQRDRGWRIDHHYLSPALSPTVTSCTIDKTPRAWEKPSDHTPVIVELAL